MKLLILVTFVIGGLLALTLAGSSDFFDHDVSFIMVDGQDRMHASVVVMLTRDQRACPIDDAHAECLMPYDN